MLTECREVVYTMDTMPRVFSLRSEDIAPLPHLYCHLDLFLPSAGYGASVYIEVGREINNKLAERAQT